MDIKKRLQNKAFWLAVAALVALMGKTFNLFTIPDNYDELINMILGLLTMLGIVIDPTTPGVSDK
ncbi:phage holin [Clostridium magnum]|uniref:Bacteriophage holin n=1 Tax=Clostridium magnum DSM 2767 TaxID=1121326 RepID=A0A162QMV8_9CLOT|nr:phage holin [Clostridium magnum]KZL88729.1 bacteriophage holin [Clostridium magnum DSM 2767]SHJ65896.1 holin, phage phi LC3 family [Clostridium magnum DSM 2767]